MSVVIGSVTIIFLLYRQASHFLKDFRNNLE